MTIEENDIHSQGSVGIKDVIDILQSGEAKPLQDTESIEAALQLIKKSEDQVKQFKELKKKRIEAINQEIETLETRVQFFKQVIIKTLKKSNQKTIKFPGIGKVSRRTKKGKWLVNDEVEMIQILKNENEFDNCVEIKEDIKKTSLNKLLDVWERVDKLPDCVEREPSEDSVTISFEKSTSDKDDIDVPDPDELPKKKDKNVSKLSFV